MKEEVLKKLEELNIAYEVVEHEAVYTIDEMIALGDVFKNAKICKNLFLRDQKGKAHFLVVIPEEKQAPLAEISEKIGSTRLSFASEERLMKYLKLKPGAVTPLAVINDETNSVKVFIDEELKKENLIGVHPCVNTATVLMNINDLERYVKSLKNNIKYIKI